jgi:hypothetical protein
VIVATGLCDRRSARRAEGFANQLIATLRENGLTVEDEEHPPWAATRHDPAPAEDLALDSAREALLELARTHPDLSQPRLLDPLENERPRKRPDSAWCYGPWSIDFNARTFFVTLSIPDDPNELMASAYEGQFRQDRHGRWRATITAWIGN